jgi:alpha-mannosidase
VSARLPDGARSPLNQLVLYEDRPQAWEAWDIDAQHKEKAYPINSPADQWRIVETGPLRGAIEVSRSLGRSSRIIQRFILEAGSPRLDMHTRVDWHESRRLLRALFPVDVRAREATYEIQLGCLERDTHANTPWQQAMFEVCAHTWMDLSMPGRGVALLNDGKYGHSCHGNVMGLSLLRSSKFPDTDADMGEHEFTYSLMPHGGDWRAAGVDHEAHTLNAPLIARPLAPGRTGPIKDSYAPIVLASRGAGHPIVSAIKPAEADSALILRLVETHGGEGLVEIAWNLPVRDVQPTDLLERPVALPEFRHDPAGQRTTVLLRPFQIVTLAAR